MTQTFRLLARDAGWVAGATVSEHVNDDNTRRFTATIRGWQKWFLWEGDGRETPLDALIAKVREIRDRIDANDDTVFNAPKGVPLTFQSW